MKICTNEKLNGWQASSSVICLFLVCTHMQYNAGFSPENKSRMVILLRPLPFLSFHQQILSVAMT